MNNKHDFILTADSIENEILIDFTWAIRECFSPIIIIVWGEVRVKHRNIVYWVESPHYYRTDTSMSTHTPCTHKISLADHLLIHSRAIYKCIFIAIHVYIIYIRNILSLIAAHPIHFTYEINTYNQNKQYKATTTNIQTINQTNRQKKPHKCILELRSKYFIKWNLTRKKKRIKSKQTNKNWTNFSQRYWISPLVRCQNTIFHTETSI